MKGAVTVQPEAVERRDLGCPFMDSAKRLQAATHSPLAKDRATISERAEWQKRSYLSNKERVPQRIREVSVAHCVDINQIKFHFAADCGTARG